MKKAVIAVALSVLLALLSANVNTVAHAQGDLSAPSNVAAQNTGNPGEVRISWDAVPNAAYYRIGWVAYSDVEPIIASGGDWLEHFAFIDIENRGQTQRTIARLTPGVQYAFIMASNDGRYGTPRWPPETGWAFLTLNEAPATQASLGSTAINLTWNAVPGATYYRIGWVVYEDVAPIIASGGDWLEHFAFIDIANRDQTEHTITQLTPGLLYAFIVAGNDGRYGTPQWPDASGWQFLTPSVVQPSVDQLSEEKPSPAQLSCPLPWVPKTTPPIATVRGDYDADDDGLVEVANLAQLRAVGRVRLSSGAFPNALPGMGCPEDSCTGYELVADLDFDTNRNGTDDAGDALWNDGKGWEPISFRGTFDGNGHTISNLFINRAGNSLNPVGNVGLFSSASGTIRNVALVSVNVRGGTYVGGLVGKNSADLKDSCIQGTVTALDGPAGGLAGLNFGDIDSSYSDATTWGEGQVGGLVGSNVSGDITGSYSTGIVSAGVTDTHSPFSTNYFAGHTVGGLVGRNNQGNIKDSYATAAVSGTEQIGGLVGSNNWNINDSYASGAVSGDKEVGGLVGINIVDYGVNIRGSYATGAVTGGDQVGGFVGHNLGGIIGNYATGSVSGRDKVGGLVGENNHSINASYATGHVTGDFRVGGLVGYVENGGVMTSYATGTVTGSSPVGGLVGTNLGGVIDSYWDTGTSGQSHSDGGQGKTTTELQSPTGYTGIYSNWNVDIDDDNTADDPWDFGTSNQYPVLKYGGLDPAEQRR